jgi:hypothetical protein
MSLSACVEVLKMGLKVNEVELETTQDYNLEGGYEGRAFRRNSWFFFLPVLNELFSVCIGQPF